MQVVPPATHDEITAIVGEIDALVIAEIQSLGATADEVRLAREWQLSSSIERREGGLDPRVGKVMELLMGEDDPYEDDRDR